MALPPHRAIGRHDPAQVRVVRPTVLPHLFLNERRMRTRQADDTSDSARCTYCRRPCRLSTRDSSSSDSNRRRSGRRNSLAYRDSGSGLVRIISAETVQAPPDVRQRVIAEHTAHVSWSADRASSA